MPFQQKFASRNMLLPFLYIFYIDMHFVDSHFTVCENVPRQSLVQDEKDVELIHWPVYAWYISAGCLSVCFR